MIKKPNVSAAGSLRLPLRANLEHLRNEARQRLKALRTGNPQTRLSEAQLEVARSYGFASWRKLKAHVDAMNSTIARLVEAVRSGDLSTIHKGLNEHPELVNAVADSDERIRPSDAPAMRLIHLAVAEGRGDVLRLLAERGADLNARNRSGRLALHDCFELDHDDFAKTLLDAGARPDVCAAAAYGMLDELTRILGADPKAANDLNTGESPLGWSVYGRQPRAAEILFEHGAIADREPFDGYAWRPAAMVGSTAVTPVLLAHGADPNWRDENGNTPMHRAIASRLISDPSQFIELMLLAGSIPNLRNRQGQTPLELAEALRDAGASAETYFPVQSRGPKQLENTIALLRSRSSKTG